jgi:outer membrane lipoprotein-sorting protein
MSKMVQRSVGQGLVGWGLALAIGAGMLLGQSTVHAGPAPRDIMDKSIQARKLDGSEALVKMVMADDKGASRERKMTMATKLFDGGKTEKRIVRFLAPADVKGTGVLLFDHDATPDDVWIFLPAMRKTRRIVSSDRKQAFLGSEFSFGDLSSPSLDEFSYNLVKEEDAGGESCFVIDVTPKDKATGEAEGYSKKTVWISKATFTVRRTDFFDKDGKLLKVLNTSDVKLIDPANKRYRAMRMEMVNKQNGRKSVFESEKVTLAKDTNDEFFTTRYLERP